MRKWETGATRSDDSLRDDPEGYLSPLVIDRFNQYMTKHRHQQDGSIRESDNWQKGMPLTTYIKGMWRHFLHLWTRHRGYQVRDEGAATDIQEDLCAILFNVQGYLHTLLVEQQKESDNASQFTRGRANLFTQNRMEEDGREDEVEGIPCVFCGVDRHRADCDLSDYVQRPGEGGRGC